MFWVISTDKIHRIEQNAERNHFHFVVFDNPMKTAIAYFNQLSISTPFALHGLYKKYSS